MNKSTIILALCTLLLAAVSVFIGVIHLDIPGLLSGDFKQVEILLISRLPRLFAILCTGVGMSVAGLIMQQL
ncbi:MAG: iron chelate uptake ABC transporter family permease subunit, partial [Treponema sp.]|nr:iron chelate uptake ABC transporter family permease subunit [Treponema sp.]